MQANLRCMVPEPYDLRASDEEREAVAAALRRHAADGRLDAEELESRLDTALGATLRADLLPLLSDLPKAPEKRPRPDSEPPWFAPVIPLAILLIAIWALTGAGYFWPIWPIGAVLLISLKHAGHGGHGCARHERVTRS
jgi:Domain of unknown function (DUF1707)